MLTGLSGIRICGRPHWAWAGTGADNQLNKTPTINSQRPVRAMARPHAKKDLVGQAGLPEHRQTALGKPAATTIEDTAPPPH
jgi:hypothetical protein